jgi:hypothetical protein
MCKPVDISTKNSREGEDKESTAAVVATVATAVASVAQHFHDAQSDFDWAIEQVSH